MAFPYERVPAASPCQSLLRLNATCTLHHSLRAAQVPARSIWGGLGTPTKYTPGCGYLPLWYRDKKPADLPTGTDDSTAQMQHNINMDEYQSPPPHLTAYRVREFIAIPSSCGYIPCIFHSYFSHFFFIFHFFKFFSLFLFCRATMQVLLLNGKIGSSALIPSGEIVTSLPDTQLSTG